MLIYIQYIIILYFWTFCSSYAWILQDFLGICFCISLIKTIRLPNLKISTILLLALLLYDIFFVFITPFFSARGKSVMVEVATGKILFYTEAEIFFCYSGKILAQLA